MSTTEARLRLLGDALVDAAAADLAQSGEEPAGAPEARRGRVDAPPARGGRADVPPRRRSRLSTRAKLAFALVAAALAIPTAAIATGVLSSSEEVAAGLPNGSAMLTGTDPTCAPLREGVVYECVLAKPPQEISLPDGTERAIGEFLGEPGEWMGVVEVTVDADHHVDGGCRSRNLDGTLWRCYLGKAAVRHQIIAGRLLGEYLPEPLQE
jgi:hypothetical protein